MSREAMIAALNLEMGSKVPRTEYSAHAHWPLVQRVTGIEVNEHSEKEAQEKASREFLRIWDYAMMWNTDIHNQIFNGKRTSMGHAEYAAGGTDYNNQVFQLFEDPEDVYDYDLFEVHGVPDVKKITQDFDRWLIKQEQLYPDCLTMNGIYVTCISGVLELLGWDTLLMAAGIDPKAFGEFINRYADWIAYYFEALAQCKSPVVMVHDDFVWGNGGFLHPDFYRKYVFPHYKRYFSMLRDCGKKILFTSDGNYSAYVDDVAACGAHGFIMEPVTDMKYVAEKYGKTHVFVGNAETGILLNGTREQIETEVKRCMDIGKHCPGFVMAVGNHIPANTPVENALYYNEIYEKLARR